MAWESNKQGGVYKRGAAFPSQKRYQIAASFFRTGSYGAAAAENMCTYDVAKKIVDKFLTNGIFDPGDRGSPPTMMQPWKVAYLEALVTHDPFVYLSEIQTALRDDLNLPPREIPSVPTICRTLLDLDLTRHKASKVPSERFSPENIARRAAFVNWRRTVDPRKLYFVDETAIQLSDGRRTYGRCHTNNNVPLISNRGDEREKMSVLSVICYNHGVLGAYPIHGSFNRVQFNYGIIHYFLPLIERDSFLVMDNASIHNERELRIILAAKNITLVKLPPYSYDFNPIELVFGITKGYVRRWPELLRVNVPFAILNAFSQVSVNSVRNFYRKCWQVLA